MNDPGYYRDMLNRILCEEDEGIDPTLQARQFLRNLQMNKVQLPTYRTYGDTDISFTVDKHYLGPTPIAYLNVHLYARNEMIRMVVSAYYEGDEDFEWPHYSDMYWTKAFVNLIKELFSVSINLEDVMLVMWETDGGPNFEIDGNSYHILKPLFSYVGAKP